MTNTTENDAPEDHRVTTESGISKVSDNERQAVGKEVERLASGVGDTAAKIQRALGD